MYVCVVYICMYHMYVYMYIMYDSYECICTPGDGIFICARHKSTRSTSSIRTPSWLPPYFSFHVCQNKQSASL